jgi:anti-sigma-K factor RskA
MTDLDPSMTGNSDHGADAAAYVLGALEGAEADVFRRHLESCAVCQDEVAMLEQAKRALPLAAPQLHAPRSLRKRIMRAVRAEPKPQIAAGVERRRAWRPSLSDTFPRVAVAAAAVLAVAAAGFGIAELTNGSSTRVIAASVIGSSGRAELRVSGSHAELVVNHLPPPPAGRIYEVWVQHGHRPPSPTSALFSVTSTGSAAVDVPGGVQDVRTVMVTPEPAGGSTVPTRAPVIVANL